MKKETTMQRVINALPEFKEGSVKKLAAQLDTSPEVIYGILGQIGIDYVHVSHGLISIPDMEAFLYMASLEGVEREVLTDIRTSTHATNSDKGNRRRQRDEMGDGYIENRKTPRRPGNHEDGREFIINTYIVSDKITNATLATLAREGLLSGDQIA